MDPFPDIEPALLNSADLLDYVATVGMLYPFELENKPLSKWVKPGSCAVPCTGEFLRFDLGRRRRPKKKPTKRAIGPKQRLELPANSITFLHLGTVFQMPNYIAARFNLAIREIHRGFLAGTGPLVDPGFVGRLFIPLHNLTSNDYSVAYGEHLLWVEFTKLSRNGEWDRGDSQPRHASLVEFPKHKLDRKTPEDYLDHAFEGKPIASSIPEEVARAEAQGRKAMKRVRRYGAIGGITVVIAAVGAVWPITNLISSTNTRLDQATRENAALTTQVQALTKRLDATAALAERLAARH